MYSDKGKAMNFVEGCERIKNKKNAFLAVRKMNATIYTKGECETVFIGLSSTTTIVCVIEVRKNTIQVRTYPAVSLFDDDWEVVQLDIQEIMPH